MKIVVFLTLFGALPSLALAQEAPEAAPDGATTPAPPETVPPEVEEARERIDRGETLFAGGDFEAALTEFQRAYDLLEGHPARPLLRFNIGKCQERLFRYDQALESYRAYLEETGDEADDREAVEATLETLEGMLGTVVVESPVPAALWVDDREVGRAPGTVRVPGGRHVVELRAAGFEPTRQEVQLAASTTETLRFDPTPLAEPFEGISPAPFWVAAGLAGATLVAGAVVGGLAVAERGSLDDRLGDDVERWRVTQDDVDQIGTLTTTADILFASAATLGVTAFVLALFTDFDGESEDSRPAPIEVGANVGAGGAAWTVRGRW